MPGLRRAKAGRVLVRKALLMCQWRESKKGKGDVLHASTATGPVAVVEVDALALEDEGSDAVL